MESIQMICNEGKMGEKNKLSVKEYKYEAPDKELAIRSISHYLGQEKAEALWVKLCDECGVPHATESLDDLGQVFKLMTKQEGPVGVHGTSLSIRLSSYKILTRIYNKKENAQPEKY